jgi:hypothetical protein
MYLSMVRKKTVSGALILCLSLLAVESLSSMERTVELGKDSLWKDMRALEGVTRVPGKWGFQDLTLTMDEYVSSATTEFLFHFNAPGEADARGNARFDKTVPSVSTDVFALGEGSAVFRGESGGAVISFPTGSMFSPGAVWQDFSIEFWAYPSILTRGETILSWEGGERRESGLSVQSLKAVFRDRKLWWDFQSFFRLPEGKSLSFTLSGTKRLLPRVWHHHLLRFDATRGTLEYMIDGVPEAITHVTDTGKEGGSVAAPRIEAGFPGELVLGQDFTGFVDELRASRRYVETPSIKPFAGRTGTATSKIIDLGFSSTRISRIEADYSTPGDSGAAFYYKVSDVWTNPKSLEDAEWTPFVPSTDFSGKLRGRYIQLMVELFPDGTRGSTPRISSLGVVYEPNLPPSPPVGLTAIPGNGKVILTWRKVNDLNVKGYRVFYGDAPGTFLGTGSSQGDSPIEAGDTTRMEIEGLENGKLYYFAVTAYDESDPPQASVFSAQVSARPSRIYP